MPPSPAKDATSTPLGCDSDSATILEMSFAADRSVPPSLAPPKNALDRFAPVTSTPIKCAFARSAPLRSAPRRLAPLSLAPCSLAPDRFAPPSEAPEAWLRTASRGTDSPCRGSRSAYGLATGWRIPRRPRAGWTRLARRSPGTSP